MKHLRSTLALAVVIFAMAMPSISAAQFYHEERLDHFLDSRPDLKGQLQHNPNLIYNKAWREQHPDLESFMQQHPNTWGKIEGSNRYGAYGPDHGGTSLTGGIRTIPVGCTRTIPNGPRIILNGRDATATSTNITNGTIAAGGTIIIPIGSMRIIRIGTSIRTSIRSLPKSTSTKWKSTKWRRSTTDPADRATTTTKSSLRTAPDVPPCESGASLLAVPDRITGAINRQLSTGKAGIRRRNPDEPAKNLTDFTRDVLHSCYKYNYISPSIGWVAGVWT